MLSKPYIILQVLETCFADHNIDGYSAEEVQTENDDHLSIEDTDTSTFTFDGNYIEASLKLHDYCGPVSCAVGSANKKEQTDSVYSSCPLCRPSADDLLFARPVNDGSTQTNVTLCSRLVQTDGPETETTTDPTYVSVGIQCKMPDISMEDLCANDKKVMFYTGLPNAGTFYALFDEMDDAERATRRNPSGDRTGRPRQLRIVDEFFLILMRLRLGLLVEDLAHRFKISTSTCSVIINKWVDYLSVKLEFLLKWPTRHVIDCTMPNKFKRVYPKTRVIIDCTEFFTENPQSLMNKSLMYSHYKSHMTYKALLGVSPAGAITFVSDLWAGSISDKQITRSCGILDLCEKGDAIMADKGFLIADLTTPRGICLIIPPLKFKRFSRREVEETRRIANLRIYVEMAMARVKTFRILQGVAPITLSKQLGKIVKLCAGLSNLQPPLVLDED